MRWWLALLAVAVASGCKAPVRYQPEWVGQAVTVPSDRVLWECTVLALEKEDFPVGSGFDPATRTAKSGWRNDLNPFRGMGSARQGYREQATVRFTPLGSQSYQVDVRVQRQVNDDIVRPLDLSYADWKDAPDNREQAELLLQVIRTLVGDSEKFEPDARRQMR